MISLVLMLTLSGCASDADCALVMRCGCTCCPSDVAVDADGKQSERQHCAKQGSCGGMEKCAAKQCPSRAGFKAVCEAGQCVKRGPPVEVPRDAGR